VAVLENKSPLSLVHPDRWEDPCDQYGGAVGLTNSAANPSELLDGQAD
jgi:hypothetical protein